MNVLKAQFSASDITYLTDGRFAVGQFDERKGAICTDTRKLRPGQWFFALSGEHFDGYDFIEEAMNAGAIGCVVNRRRRYPSVGPATKLVSVPDTKQAYFSIARAWRTWAQPLVIAVTSPTRQTAVTSACSILFAGLRCQTTDFSVSEELAIPATVLSMRKSCQLLMVNMNPRRPGWLSLIADTARPQIAVIADNPRNDSRLIRWQCELLSGLDESQGLAIITTSDEETLNRARATFAGKIQIFSPDLIAKVDRRDGRCLLQLKDSKLIFSLPSSQMLVEDAWAAITCGREYGLSDEFMASQFSQVSTLGKLKFEDDSRESQAYL